MTHTELENIKRFKSKPLGLSFAKGDAKSNIDFEKGIIKNVVMCQVGEAKGHGLHLEQDFIDGLVAYDKKNFAKIGVKCRFGHPAMSDTTMGTQMGMFHNFKVVGDKAVGDLQLLEAAELSPTRPKMRSWMLKMAEEQPDFVMMSIVFNSNTHYQRDENGKKRKIWYYKEVKDDEGNQTHVWVSSNPELGNVYVDFDDTAIHYYTDAVEAGAATENLFSNQFNNQKYAVAAADWLSNENPQILKFLQENPNKLLEFATKCGIKLPKQKYTVGEKAKAFKEYIFGSEEAEGIVAFDEENHITKETHETLLAEARTEFETEKTALKTTQTAEIELKEKEITQLKNQIEVLKKEPIEAETTFEETPANEAQPNKFLCETTRKVMADLGKI